VLKLLIQDDEGRKTRVPFSRDEITIGREDGNTIRLTERNVSRRHARLFRHSAQIFIEDLKSHNGIHVNGHRIRGQAVVRHGDTICIGDYDIVIEGATSLTPPLPSPSLKNSTSQDSIPLSALFSEANTPSLMATPHRPLTPETESPEYESPEYIAYITKAPTLPLPPLQGVSAASPAAVDTFDLTPEPSTSTHAAASLSSADTFDLHADEALENNVQPNEVLSRERPTIRLPEFIELPEADSPRLIALNLNARGREFPCSRNELSLGRANINDIVLSHSSVAAIHCRLERDEKGRWFVALSPQYAVLVNGEPYQNFALEHKDILTLGQQELQFLLPASATAPLAKKNPPRNAKKIPRAPLWASLFLTVFTFLGVVYYYWKTGVLHDSSWEGLSAFSIKYLPLPPYFEPPSEKPPTETQNMPTTGHLAQTPPPNEKLKTPSSSTLTAPPGPQPQPPEDTTKTNTTKTDNAKTDNVKTDNVKTDHAKTDNVKTDNVKTDHAKTHAKTNAKSHAKTENTRMSAALHTSSKQDSSSSKPEKALEKPTGRSSSKATASAAIPSRLGARAPRADKSTEAPVAEQPASMEAPALFATDMDLFMEEVNELKQKALNGMTGNAQRSIYSELHHKLLSCKTAECAYELAATSLELANLNNPYARTRYPDEFEAYLARRDRAPAARERKKKACEALRDYYGKTGNAAKLQTISEICTQ